ncbi:MAG: zinc-binding dehydrogenase [Peptococcaceae bacterium]|nr:zinc-binding dehydrogenase [Peptococcaceae bacterium]
MKTLLIEKTPERLMAVISGGPEAVFGDSSHLRYIEITSPEVPRGWIRVKNRLSGICGSDLHLIYLDVDLGVHPALLPGSPVTYLGHEVVGTVLEAGPENVLKPGDRVIRRMRVGGGSCLAHGLDPCPQCRENHYNHCERTGLPDTVGGGFGDEFYAPEKGLLKIPDELPDDQAVLVEPAAVSVRGVLRCPPSKNQKVIVLGAGTIGFFVLQALRAVCPDCDITAVAQFGFQRDLALRYGAGEVWMAHEDLLEKAAGKTGGRVYAGLGGGRTLVGGFDIVYDCVGTSETLQLCLRLARSRGSVVLVGAALRMMNIDLSPVWYNEVNLIGTASHCSSLWRGERVGDFELAISWMLEGVLDTDGFITHRFRLDRYREAILAAADKSESKSVKVVFEF